MWDFLISVHLLGLSLGLGAALVKLVLLLKCKAEYEFLPVYLKVYKPITRLIVFGLILMTLTGITWLIRGYSFTPLLTSKVILVGIVWILGPVIDNVVEPAFVRTVPSESHETPAYLKALGRYLAIEIVADILFVAIMIMGALL